MNWRTSHVLHFTRTFHPTLSSNSEVYPLRSSLEILRVVGNAIWSYCSMKSLLKLNVLHRIETASGSTAPRAPNHIGKTEKNCYMENKLGVLRISLDPSFGIVLGRSKHKDDSAYERYNCKRHCIKCDSHPGHRCGDNNP
ncbi:hypothetical protein GQR58_028955 [Nymphon striatum]|nr:hypothetical protein GQR58_028955 [Nymphon striatum]